MTWILTSVILCSLAVLSYAGWVSYRKRKALRQIDQLFTEYRQQDQARNLRRGMR